MDALPEELLVHTINYLVPAPSLLTRPLTPTLHALCLTSRRFYRLAKSHLYTHIQSNSGSRGINLLRTLDKNPCLAQRVEHFAVQHADEQNDEYTGQIKDIAVRTIRLLSNLKTLDVSRCKASSIWWDITIDPDSLSPSEKISIRGSKERSVLVPSAPHLHTVSLHLHHAPARLILPYLKLPSIRVLEIDVRERLRDRFSYTPSYHTNTPVQHLRLVGNGSWRQSDIRWLGEELVNLRTLFLAVSELDGWISCVVWMFGHHFWRGHIASMQIAVEGWWHYDVEFEAMIEDSDMYRTSDGQSTWGDLSERAQMYRGGRRMGGRVLGLCGK